MKPVTIFSLAFLVATTSAIAQSNITLTPPIHVDAARCPVGLEAKHGQNSGLTQTASVGPPADPAANRDRSMDQRPEDLYQQLHLTLINPSPREITGGQITVHGLSAKWRTTELSRSAGVPDLSKTVNFALDLKGNSRASRDLSLNRFSAITSVELTAITYVDGMAWHAQAAGACTVTPDLLMLISSN